MQQWLQPCIYSKPSKPAVITHQRTMTAPVFNTQKSSSNLVSNFSSSHWCLGKSMRIYMPKLSQIRSDTRWLMLLQKERGDLEPHGCRKRRGQFANMSSPTVKEQSVHTSSSTMPRFVLVFNFGCSCTNLVSLQAIKAAQGGGKPWI